MSLLSDDLTDELFAALKLVEKYLPVIATTTELLAPGTVPFVETAEYTLSKIFEAVATLRDTHSLAELEAKARARTIGTLQQIADQRQAVDDAMADIASHLASR